MKEKLKKILPKGDFTKNVLTLMTGTTIAQAIPILMSLILTRLYSPEEFGVFALYVSITAIVAVIATGRYEMAIVLPKKDSDAINILVLALSIALLVSFLFFIFVFLFNDQITFLLGNPNISNWLYLMFVSILLVCVYQGLNYYSNRKKEYKKLALSKVSQSIVTAISNLVFVGFSFGGGGLIISQIIGQLFATTILSSLVLRNSNILKFITKEKVVEVAEEYSVFPKVTLWSSMINSLYNSGKFIVFGFVFLPGVIGQFYLTFRVIMTPVSIVSTSIADVLFQKTSVMNNKELSRENVFKKLMKVFGVLVSIAIIPSLVMFFYGEDLFTFIFGDKWSDSGKYASIMSLVMFFQFSVAPFCKIFYVFKENKIYLLWEFIRVVLFFGPLLVFSKFYDYSVIELTWIMSICISLSYLILMLFLYKILRRNV